MRRLLTSLIGATAVLVAAVAVFVVATLPPAARPILSTPNPQIVWGAFHVHSNRSDGSGSLDDIAGAAAAADLHFVIVTDHGDGTRAPEPPAYRHGVLVIDAVEINSAGGHLVALGLSAPAPYPLAGETRDVLEDIHRLGGVGVVAHPDSSREGLSWRARGPQEFDGIEWLNLDSAWRQQGAAALAGVVLRSFVRGPEAIASMISTPLPALSLADSTNRTRQVFLVAGLDAHARLGAEPAPGESAGKSLALPSYETLFRTLVQAVSLDAPLGGDPAADSRAILSSLTSGRSFSVIRAIADGLPGLTFTATQDGKTAGVGDALPGGAPTTFSAEVTGLGGVRLSLLRDGRPVAQTEDALRADVQGEPGAYRLEVYAEGRDVPWIVTNPIHLTRALPGPPPGAAAERGAGAGASGAVEALAIAVPPDSWRVESDPASRSGLATSDGALRLSYTLAGGEPFGQYVALSTGAAGDLPLERIDLTLRSAKPMRISVQVRTPGGRDGYRWRRSVYIDDTPRAISLRLSELEPVERGSALRPNVARVQSVLLVVDTLNAHPGSSGEVSVLSARLVPGRQ